MPLTEVDPNVGRRSSLGRSSVTSAKSSVRQPDNRHLGANGLSDVVSNPAGVLSMLKTTTETGDIGILSVTHDRLHKFPPHPNSRRQNGTAASAASSQYSRAGSLRSKGSARSKGSIRESFDQPASESWSYSHHPHASSLDLPLSRQGSRPDASHHSTRSIATLSDRNDADQRSYSLTQTLPPDRSLSKHRSAASLRSHGGILSRPKSPFMYPTRLRRPGFRPGSPALSDTSHSRPPDARLGPAPIVLNGSWTPPKGMIEPQLPHLAWRPSANMRPYPKPDAFNQATQTFSRSQRMIMPESRYQQQTAILPLPLSAPASYYSRSQQPFVSNPSPLSNNSSTMSPPEPVAVPNPEVAPYAGFVQRVKKALEERASMEELRKMPRCDGLKSRVQGSQDDAVAEMPASPVVRRLTRDMIKAAMGPPSDSGAASPPDGAEYLQAETSTAGGSSIRADPSFEIHRTIPDVTIEIHRASSAPPSEDTSRIAALSDAAYTGERPRNLASNWSPVSRAAHLRPSMESPFSGSAGSANENRREISMAKLISEHSLNPSPETPTKHERRPASLPQAQTTQHDSSILQRQSLPICKDPDQKTNPTFHSVLKRDRVVMDARPSVSSVETEETAPAEVATAPPSAQSSFRANLRQVQEIDVPTWATSSIKARSRPDLDNSDPKDEDVDAHDELQPETNINVIKLPASNQASRTSLTDDCMPSIESVGPTSLNGTVQSDRLSAMKQFHFPLPDLTEDSQEDASTTNLRILGSKPPTFRAGGQRRLRREVRSANQHAANLEPPPSYVSRKLINTRNMPSLNFSHMDLTTKLNNALNIYPSQSPETLKRLTEHHGFHEAVENRNPPATLRDRYKSFFSDIESVSDKNEAAGDDSQQCTSVAQKHLSNDELVNEIERFSIPSVSGLTLRLSELLPAIKKCSSQLDLTGGTETLDSGNENSKELNSPERTKSLERKTIAITSSLYAGNIARSRRSVHGAQLTSSSVCNDEYVRSRLMKELPPLPTQNNLLGKTSTSGVESGNEGENTATDIPAELEATVPIDGSARDRHQALHIDNHATQSKETQTAPCMLPGTPDSRPWNKTSNYPWNANSPAIAISPSSPLAGISDAQARSRAMSAPKTPMNLSRHTTERIVRSMSPGPHVDNFLVPEGNLEEEIEKIGSNRSGLLGSTQRKMGMRPRVDKAGFPVDPIFLHPEERFTEPGDRYPTSGLTPPSNVNIEQARSYFSDDSSDHEPARCKPPRKRLTRLRQRHSSTRGSNQLRSVSQGGSWRERSRVIPWHTLYDSASDLSNMSVNNPDFIAVYDQPPAGMSKLEYRAKRILEKLRIFWCRSGNVIRSLSRARKHSQIWYEPGEMYEGV